MQTIRQKTLVAGESGSIHAMTHRIAFVYGGGTIRISIHTSSESVTVREDEFIFLPLGIRFEYDVLESGSLLILSLDSNLEAIPECHTFRLQRDNHAKTGSTSAGYIYPLRANDRIKYFIEGILQTESDGLKCRSYARLTVNQFLFLIQVYYPQDIYTRFYSAIFNSDVEFSDFVYTNCKKYPTVVGLARAFNTTTRQFSERFLKVFGESPGSWLSNRKRVDIYQDICNSHKILKEIAAENNLSLPNFTRYCRTNFGQSPGAIRAQLQAKKGSQ
jgi:AraC-like DNA-binding protein